MMKKFDKIIFLTPFKGIPKDFYKTYNSVSEQLQKNDLWIIIIDGNNKDDFREFKKKNILIFKNKNSPGAGHARNYGLKYIINHPFPS